MDENKYVRKYFKQGILQSTVNGRFFIEKDARETFLVFTDSILLASKKHGDTLLLQAENVHFINDTMFRIGSRKNASGNSIFQFKRIE